MSAPTRPQMPKDIASYPVQCLAPDESTHVQVTVSGTSAEIPIPTGVLVYELNVSVDCHVRVGLSAQGAATTADRYLPAGSYVYSVMSVDHEEIVIIKAATVSGSGIASFVQLR